MTTDTTSSDGGLEQPTEWATLHTLLAECLKEPSETFVEEVTAGRLQTEFDRHVDALGLDVTDTNPPVPESRGSLQESSLALFEAMAQPYAPPAESPYKPWHGDREGGLLGGPPATDMEHRYEALDAEPPAGYPVDHVALLLEYGALLLEAGEISAYRAFLLDHLDWIPAFHAVVEDATAEAPFYRWTVARLEEVLAQLRARLAVPEPDEASINDMCERVRGGGPQDRDRGFAPVEPR